MIPHLSATYLPALVYDQGSTGGHEVAAVLLALVNDQLVDQGDPDIFQAEMDRQVHGQEDQGAEAEREIAKLNRRLANVDHRETELVALRLRGTVSKVALDRNAALLRVERTHLTEELERQREIMSTLEQGQASVASLKAPREHMHDRLDSATPEDQRTVLEALETRVTVGIDGLLEVSIVIPQQVADCVQRTQCH